MFILWFSNLLFLLVLNSHDFDNYSMIGYIFLFIFLLDDFYQSLSSVRRLYGTYGGVLSGGAVRERWFFHYSHKLALALFIIPEVLESKILCFNMMSVGSSEPFWLKNKRLSRRY